MIPVLAHLALNHEMIGILWLRTHTVEWHRGELKLLHLRAIEEPMIKDDIVIVVGLFVVVFTVHALLLAGLGVLQVQLALYHVASVLVERLRMGVLIYIASLCVSVFPHVYLVIDDLHT